MSALSDIPRNDAAVDQLAESNLSNPDGHSGGTLRGLPNACDGQAPADPFQPKQLADVITVALDGLASDPGAIFEPVVLAALRKVRSKAPARFARIRSQVKGIGNVSMAEFDRITAVASVDEQPSMFFSEVDPWSEPVNGAVLLQDLVTICRRYVVADPPTIQAAVLWILHTYLMDVAQVSPIANICAPEMRCGKTVLLSVLGKLSYRPMQAASIATAALFRIIEACQPTLLIDEVDTFLSEHDEARGIINSGFTRDSAYVIRCVGDAHEPTKFATWGPKALCGIGKLATTLADRSIPLRLRRKTSGEQVENLRHADLAQWKHLCARITRWTNDHRNQIHRARPAPIDGLNDRANDCWEPLLSIADAVGGEWPIQARTAAAILHGLDADAPTIGVQLLSDIHAAFGSRDRMTTADLLNALVADDEALWPTWNRGKPMTARQLSARLAEFGIRSNTIRIGNQTAKGYMLAQFADAFDRYLADDSPFSCVTTSQPNGGAGCEPFPSVTPHRHVTDRKAGKVNGGAGCDGVTYTTPPTGATADEYRAASRGAS